MMIPMKFSQIKLPMILLKDSWVPHWQKDSDGDSLIWDQSHKVSINLRGFIQLNPSYVRVNSRVPG